MARRWHELASVVSSSSSAEPDASAIALPRHRPAVPRIIAGLAAGLTVLALVGLLVDRAELRSAIAVLGSRPELLAMFVAAYAGAFWLRAIAWKRLLTHRTGVFSLFAVLHAALLANHLLPFKAGEAVRPYLAGQRGVPLGEAAATTAIARLLDLASLTAIVLFLSPLLPVAGGNELGASGLALPATVIVVAATALVAVRSGRLAPRLPQPLRPWVDALRVRLRQVSARQTAAAALWTAPSWVLEAGAVLVAAKALGLELSPAAAIAVTAFTIVFQVFHVTPGGIGVYEASMTGALAALGIPVDQGLAVAVLTHGLKFAYSYSVAAVLTLIAARSLLGVKGLGAIRGTSDGARAASRFEIAAARLWNVVNEGKPFTPVFAIAVVMLLSIPHAADLGYLGTRERGAACAAPAVRRLLPFRLPDQASGRVVGIPGRVPHRIPVR